MYTYIQKKKIFNTEIKRLLLICEKVDDVAFYFDYLNKMQTFLYKNEKI